MFILEKANLYPVISITVDVQGVSGGTMLVTGRANETPSLEMFRLNVTS